MPVEDRHRWDERYIAEERYQTFVEPRPFLVEHASHLPRCGWAIDLAMGLGGNASFLLQRGLNVIGVDISSVAVRQACARLPGLLAIQADLTHFCLPEERFDVLLNFFYLQRDLWPAYERALRPGGLLVMETLTGAMNETHPEIDPVYLLEPQELLGAFPGLETLAYREEWTEGRSGHPRATAALIARKP